MFLGDEMILNLIDNWEVALDGFQIFLCCLILVFLVCNRKKSKLIKMKSSANANAGGFNTEIRIQSIKQQADQIFDTILNSINREKQNLERLFEASLAADMSKTAQLRITGAVHSPQYGEARFTMGQHEPTAETHQLIETLAARGMGAGEIASQLKVPLAEVELLLKIKKDSLGIVDPKNLEPVTVPMLH